MKKIFISVALLLATISGTKAQTTTIRQDINKPIAELNIQGKSIVKVVKDNKDYIDVVVNGSNLDADSLLANLPKGLITVADSMITIRDNEGTREYVLHLNPKTLRQFSTSPNAQLEMSSGDFPNAAQSYSEEHYVINGKALTIINGDTLENTMGDATELPIGKVGHPDLEFGYAQGNPTQRLIDSMYTYISELNSHFNTDMPFNEEIVVAPKKDSYNLRNGTDIDFFWGFTNWGDTPLNGLMKMPGAYNLKTSFSSYQLAWNYRMLMTRHWSAKVGVGYESDVYKFTNDYVAFTNNGGNALEVIDEADRPLSGGEWKSKMVTRYVTLPISINYRTHDKGGRFNVGVGVVPGLCFNGKHTGMKHIMEQRGANYKNTEDISSLMNPYKCDVRFDIGFGGTSIFVQVPTMPVFIADDLPQIYPIKVGFMI